MTGYEQDRSLWSGEQIAALKAGEWSSLDVPMLVRVLDGESPKDIERHLRKLLTALIKWDARPLRRNARWLDTMRHHRFMLNSCFEDTPTFRADAIAALDKEYALATYRAAFATGVECVPGACPWSLEQVLDYDFLPGALSPKRHEVRD